MEKGRNANTSCMTMVLETGAHRRYKLYPKAKNKNGKKMIT